MDKIGRHNYWPDFEAMGDCSICGYVQEHPIHEISTVKKARILVRDDSGHSYLIPEEEKKCFYLWVEAIENDQNSSFDYSNCMVEEHKLRIYDCEEIK